MQNIYLGKDVKYEKNSLNIGPLVVGDRTVIEKDATILPQTVIGEDCHIGEGTSISSSVLFPGVKIGKNCNIKDSIISKNVTIGNNVKVEEVSVIGDNSVIGDDNILKCGVKINLDTKLKKDSVKF
jgi:NDP-sugar pyrophosphorylase family protein